MATYKFKCYDCFKEYYRSGILIDNRNVTKPECPYCRSINVGRTMHQAPSFSFAEDLTQTVSTKSERYWDNAEKVRLEALEKRRKERFEKVMSKDPETVQKIRDKITNVEATGGEEYGRELRGLIKE